jgi:hypothetical protein
MTSITGQKGADNVTTFLTRRTGIYCVAGCYTERNTRNNLICYGEIEQLQFLTLHHRKHVAIVDFIIVYEQLHSLLNLFTSQRLYAMIISS